MAENPYQSPASMQLGHEPANGPTVAKPIKWRRLIWAVLILDSLPCLFRLLIIAGDVVGGHARHLLSNYPNQFFQLYGFMVGIAVCGLCGNGLVLLKRKAGIPFVVASIVLVIAFDGIALWEHRNESGPRAFLFLVAMIMIRLAWLVFYGAVVWTAAKENTKPSTSLR